MNASGWRPPELLITRPSVLLADEPTGNLDSSSSASILALLAELNAEGVTVLIITHDHEVADQAPRRITVGDGRIVSEQ